MPSKTYDSISREEPDKAQSETYRATARRASNTCHYSIPHFSCSDSNGESDEEQQAGPYWPLWHPTVRTFSEPYRWWEQADLWYRKPVFAENGLSHEWVSIPWSETDATVNMVESSNPKIRSVEIDYSAQKVEIDLFAYVPLLFSVKETEVRMRAMYRGNFKSRYEVTEKLVRQLPVLEKLSDKEIREYDWDAFFTEIVNVTDGDLNEDKKAESDGAPTSSMDLLNASLDAAFATQGEKVAKFVRTMNKQFPAAGRAISYLGGAGLAAYALGKLGAAIGTAIGGPPGTVLGGAIGATAGAMVGSLGAHVMTQSTSGGGGMATSVSETNSAASDVSTELGGLWGAARDLTGGIGWTFTNAGGSLLVTANAAFKYVAVIRCLHCRLEAALKISTAAQEEGVSGKARNVDMVFYGFVRAIPRKC